MDISSIKTKLGLIKKAKKDGGPSKLGYFTYYIYPITIILGTLMMIGVMLFLHQNVYKTISQAELVSNLKSKVAEEGLNLKRFNQIIEKMGKKKTCLDVASLKSQDPTIFQASRNNQEVEQQKIIELEEKKSTTTETTIINEN
jgi:cell division protein FtsL